MFAPEEQQVLGMNENRYEPKVKVRTKQTKNKQTNKKKQTKSYITNVKKKQQIRWGYKLCLLVFIPFLF